MTLEKLLKELMEAERKTKKEFYWSWKIRNMWGG